MCVQGEFLSTYSNSFSRLTGASGFRVQIGSSSQAFCSAEARVAHKSSMNSKLLLQPAASISTSHAPSPYCNDCATATRQRYFHLPFATTNYLQKIRVPRGKRAACEIATLHTMNDLGGTRTVCLHKNKLTTGHRAPITKCTSED